MNLPDKELIAKDNSMFLVIFGIWFLLIMYFDPKIISNIKPEETIWAKVTVGAFILCVNSFWLMGIYQFVISIFSRFVAKPLLKCEFITDDLPAVAILYPTKDDFKEEAALSCLNQDYPNFAFYILDDSTEQEIKSQIDNFVSKHPSAKLIRRGEKGGFKAGNLNNALRKISPQYPYFAVSDADGILPKDFIKLLIPYFSLDESIGFIQAHQQINPNQGFIFSKYLHYQSDIHYKYFLPSKNKYGFVMFYGHGGIIRTDLWQKTGGFPDSLTEDFVFSSEARRLGYRGIYVTDLVCYEDFPQDYRRYRIRSERWASGTAEYFLKWYPKLLFSKDVPWFEKIDITLSAGRLLFGLPFAFFIFILCVALPLSTRYFNLPLPSYMSSASSTPLYESIPLYFSGSYSLVRHQYVNWGFGFFVLMVLYGFSDLAIAFVEWRKKPVTMLGYMSQYTMISFSTILLLCKTILLSPFSKKRAFHVTGVKGHDLGKEIYKVPVKLDHFTIVEVLVGAFLLISIIKTSNVWLAPIGIALMANPLLYKFRWETPGVHIIVILPFVLFLLIILLVGLTFL